MAVSTCPYHPGLPEQPPVGLVTSRAFRRKGKHQELLLYTRNGPSPDPHQKGLWVSPNVWVTSALVGYKAVPLSPCPGTIPCEHAFPSFLLLPYFAGSCLSLLLPFPHYQLETSAFTSVLRLDFRSPPSGLLVTHSKGVFARYSFDSGSLPCWTSMDL